MGLLGVLASLLFVRHIDRRVILLTGVGACGLCQLAFAVAWTAAPGSAAAAKAVIAFISLFTFFYVAYGKTLAYTLYPNASDIGFANTNSPVRVASRWRVSQ